MRLVRALLGALVVGFSVCLTALLTGAPASAHASLVSTDPVDGSVVAALPEQVTLTFNEPVRLVVDDPVRGFADDGSDWAVEAQARDKTVVITPVDDPGAGTVVLAWHVISEDGHEISGALTFTIDGAAAAAAPSVDAPVATDVATWTARGVVAAGLAALAVLAVVGGSGRSALWYAAFAGAVLLAPLERLRAEGRGLSGLRDWLAWLDGFTDGRTLLLLGGVVLAGFLVAARRPLVAGAVGAGVVLTLAGVLVMEPAAPDVAAVVLEPATEEASADLGSDGTAEVTVEPVEGRQYRVGLRLLDPEGAPLRPYAAPTVGLSNDDLTLGEPELERTGPGEYRAVVTIPQDGEWTVRVSVRVDEFTNPVADLAVVLGSS